MENLILSSDKTIYFSGTHCSLLYFIFLHCTCNLLLICLFVYFQCSSVAQSCPTLCDLMNHSTPGLPVHHQLLEFTQTHVYQVGDAIQPSHPLSSPFPPAPNPSQHQGLFQWVKSSHEVATVLQFQLQHQSFQWTPGLISYRMDRLDLCAVQKTLKSLLTTVQKHQFFGAQFSYSPTLTSIHDHWKKP